MQKISSFISSNATYLLMLMSALAWLGSIFVLQWRPPDTTLGETASWWGTSLNLIHGHGYSLCVSYYFPFCNAGNQVSAAREPLPVFLFAAVAMLFKESLLAAGVTELFIHIGIITRRTISVTSARTKAGRLFKRWSLAGRIYAATKTKHR